MNNNNFTSKLCFVACSKLQIENGQCDCLNRQSNNSNELYTLLPTVDFTGYYDDNKKPIYVGDILRSEWGYDIVVVKEGNSYSGKLVCEDNHSCKNMSYALNKGKGHSKINCL